jgi:molybdopterin-guanine dinucleotide biosynthesis protein
MIPILSIVGKSDSGKTFLIERWVSGVTVRGYRIATIKHDVHGSRWTGRKKTAGGTRRRALRPSSSPPRRRSP